MKSHDFPLRTHEKRMDHIMDAISNIYIYTDIMLKKYGTSLFEFLELYVIHLISASNIFQI